MSETVPAEQEETPGVLDLTLLANFVHQIVNPLNGVAGTFDNLAEGLIKEEARREQRLKLARAQIEQCITLMRNLAFLAQGSGGVAEQDRRKVVLPQVIIESLMFYQEDGKAKAIEISLINRRAQNKVFGHPELIRQALMNIFDNCVKYGKRLSTIEADQWVQESSGMAVITIRGSSEHPILPAEISKICDLGFRGSNARKTVASGTGLGLYICREIIQNRHRGTLHIQADGQNGILFTIKLPNGEASEED